MSMKNNARTTAETVTNDVAKVSVVISDPSYDAAVKQGAAELVAREQRYELARKAMASPEALRKLGLQVTELDVVIFAHCLDKRQAEAHGVCEEVLLPAIARTLECDPETEAYENAYNHVLAGFALLVQRAPSTVRGEPEQTLWLRERLSAYRAMRGVNLAIAHTTPADKLAAIRAVEQKRELRMADALNHARKLLNAPNAD